MTALLILIAKLAGVTTLTCEVYDFNVAVPLFLLTICSLYNRLFGQSDQLESADNADCLKLAYNSVTLMF